MDDKQRKTKELWGQNQEFCRNKCNDYEEDLDNDKDLDDNGDLDDDINDDNKKANHLDNNN